MVVDKTLYDVLGVDENATTEQINKAFKKKSLEHHPDRGGDHEMMQQINAAKEVLTDPQKREIYDRYGLEGMRSGMGEGNFGGFSEFPGGIFDIFDLFNHGSNRRGRAATPKGSDIKHILRVSLEELYSGNTKTISIDREVICTDCNGYACIFTCIECICCYFINSTGCHDGVSRECTKCEGRGIETRVFRMGPIIQQMQSKCSSCNGEGTTINSRNCCKSCRGKKVVRQTKSMDVDIAPGSHDGETIKFSGEGNQVPKGENGTVYAFLQQQPHSVFERVGHNLTMKLKINLSESLCGFHRVITLLDGHKIVIKHPPGKPIVPNSYRCLKGQGMPNRHAHSHGDLIIHFDVEFPKENFIKNETQLKQLEAILPQKQRVRLSSKEYYEETEMLECEPPLKKSQHQHFGNGYHFNGTENGEDDDTHGHPQGVQCQTQ
ncbi:unnamed protein product [Rotaria sp. Silwood2]|nr:unnamed protein product [Rotaria sp. Silwood2]CAF4160020.1 unnamed protein product [Rotaria sp. Silwood2]CAF4215313.1 unnamed protein product [Rotaria sp. Silwood2]CAF4287027.1 unnamed protein product [Rotaria sp. Silwood2]